jgi:hypothetical protein
MLSRDSNGRIHKPLLGGLGFTTLTFEEDFLAQALPFPATRLTAAEVDADDPVAAMVHQVGRVG